MTPVPLAPLPLTFVPRELFLHCETKCARFVLLARNYEIKRRRGIYEERERESLRDLRNSVRSGRMRNVRRRLTWSTVIVFLSCDGVSLEERVKKKDSPVIRRVIIKFFIFRFRPSIRIRLVPLRGRRAGPGPAADLVAIRSLVRERKKERKKKKRRYYFVELVHTTRRRLFSTGRGSTLKASNV